MSFFVKTSLFSINNLQCLFVSKNFLTYCIQYLLRRNINTYIRFYVIHKYKVCMCCIQNTLGYLLPMRSCLPAQGNHATVKHTHITSYACARTPRKYCQLFSNIGLYIVFINVFHMFHTQLQKLPSSTYNFSDEILQSVVRYENFGRKSKPIPEKN